MKEKINFFDDNPDMLWHLKNRVDWKSLFSMASKADREAISVTSPDEYRDLWISMLQTLGELAGSQIAPTAPAVEREDLKLVDGEVQFGPTLTANVEAIKQMGFPGLSMPTVHGGMSAPFMIEGMAAELFARACASTFLNISWWGPIAAIVDEFATEEVKASVIPRMATGEWSGSMALTESGAGSDLSEIRTYGEEQADGTWRLFGSKLFISNGNGEVCLVLAQNKKGAKGLESLNLYLALRHESGAKNFQITKLEEKIGLHQSATCELLFDNTKAILLGANGKGFKYMLHLMNDMRMGVGFQGLGFMESIYRLAVKYAKERKTWGKPIERHEMIAERLLDMHVDIAALRSVVYQSAALRSVSLSGERRMRDQEMDKADRSDLKRRIHRADRKIREYTPLMKYWAGERSHVMGQQALQIHGGYGYSREYRAEAWLREALILSIYEGTSQMQALLCLKDTMKYVMSRPMGFVKAWMGDVAMSWFAGTPLRRRLHGTRRQLARAIVSIIWRLVRRNGGMNFKDLSPAMVHAERLTILKCYTVMGESLVRDAEIDKSRAWIAERFLNRAITLGRGIQAQIRCSDPVLGRHIRGAGILGKTWEQMSL